MNAPSPVNQTQAVRRPQPTDFVPFDQLTVGQFLADPRVLKAISESAPRHFSPERLLRVMVQALRKTPKLGECSPLSLMGAMITCASLGLEPNTPLGHAYLIPFEKRGKRNGQWVTESVEVNLIIGYQGLIDLSRRTGSLVSIHADVVYEGDEFSFEYGSNMHLRHVPTASDMENRQPTHAYAHAKLSDGQAFEVRPYSDVLKLRDNTQAYKAAMEAKAAGRKNWATTPWVAYEHEMACKTMVRRLAKWLPKSIEFATAVQLDSYAERGMIDFKAIGADYQLAKDPEGALLEQAREEQREQENKKPATPTPPKPKAAAVPAETPRATPEEIAAQEDAEREADRLQRTANEGPEFAEGNDDGDEWDSYLSKMLAELSAQKTVKDVSAVKDTFRDAVVAAAERKEITDERANVLLGIWNPAGAAALLALAEPKKKR